MPAIEHARAAGALRVPTRWFRRVEDAPDDIAGVLAVADTGQCVFHASGCEIQRVAGHAALPSACQHFPRSCVIDRRGVFVTLSHYCPTAAALLFDPASAGVTIVTGPPALPSGDAEGLDARDALPPMRSPRMLMDDQEYSAWERHMVAVLTSGIAPDAALATLAAAAEAGCGPLSHGVHNRAALFALARGAVPAPYSWPVYVEPHLGLRGEEAAIVGRYLAAHAFGCWMAYQGNGLLSIITYLHVALAVLACERARCGDLREAIRQSDLLLRHLADRDALADAIVRFAAR